MKNLYINNRLIIKQTACKIAMLLVLVTTMLMSSCSDDEACGYADNCVESCELFEDFENETAGASGNWLGIADGGVFYEIRNGSTVLHANDGSGASWAYNTVDFPANLIDQGCELQFDVEFDANGPNTTTVSPVFQIFDGTAPNSNTILATFRLNSSSLIISNTGFNTVAIPLELGTVSGGLPSNSFGQWEISGVTTLTPADITNFNNLIQNISGVSFWLDSGGSPSEQYWYDNFCFKQCCP